MTSRAKVSVQQASWGWHLTNKQRRIGGLQCMAMPLVVCEPWDYCPRWVRGTYSEPVRMQLACPIKCPEDKPISKEIVTVFVSLLPSYWEALESCSTTFHLSELSLPLSSLLSFSPPLENSVYTLITLPLSTSSSCILENSGAPVTGWLWHLRTIWHLSPCVKAI